MLKSSSLAARCSHIYNGILLYACCFFTSYPRAERLLNCSPSPILHHEQVVILLAAGDGLAVPERLSCVLRTEVSPRRYCRCCSGLLLPNRHDSLDGSKRLNCHAIRHGDRQPRLSGWTCVRHQRGNCRKMELLCFQASICNSLYKVRRKQELIAVYSLASCL